MNRESLKKNLELRRYIYFFMGRSLYSIPTERFFEEARENGVFRELKSMEFPGTNLISDFIDEKIEIDLLEEEYNRLFLNPNGVLVAPWESVYRSKESIILDEHTLEVRRFYSRYNLSKVEKTHPDDHLGYELEFMSYLIGRSIEEIETAKFKDYLKGQDEFLNQHLLKWVEDFTYRLIVETESNFYKGIGLFLSEYLKLDGEILRDILEGLN